jgi:hypothetical protein
VMHDRLAGFEFSACAHLPFSGVSVCVCLVINGEFDPGSG